MLKIDEITVVQSRGKFARICVEIDLSKKLIPQISVLGNTLNIEYEEAPSKEPPNTAKLDGGHDYATNWYGDGQNSQANLPQSQGDLIIIKSPGIWAVDDGRIKKFLFLEWKVDQDSMLFMRTRSHLVRRKSRWKVSRSWKPPNKAPMQNGPPIQSAQKEPNFVHYLHP
ncbi:hypothetical protein PIB30_061744 [Stylosanthes scabra]|uniref:Uncharacterized protein n=1 Tax=Stylosanthes scabra TaxID=79078 RepID=A0ABU6RL54_9FABA|nr:hypothetical protein [Stylosanthes scabra]